MGWDGGRHRAVRLGSFLGVCFLIFCSYGFIYLVFVSLICICVYSFVIVLYFACLSRHFFAIPMEEF